MWASDARRLYSEGRFDELLSASLKKLSSAPHDVAALEFVSVALVQLGRHAEAESYLWLLVEARPEATEFRVYLGVLLLHLGKLVPALACLEQAAVADPADLACQFNLGLTRYKLHRFAQAVDAFVQVRERAPAMAGMAALYEARARIELGQLDVARALLLALSNAAALPAPQVDEYALACISLNLFDEAEAALRAALTSEPGARFLCAKLAQICERSNRLSEARHWLTQVATADVHARHLQIRLDARDGDPAVAVQAVDELLCEFAAVLEVNPDFRAQVEFDRGRWLDELKRYSEAAAAFSRGNALDREQFLRNVPGVVIEGGLPWLAAGREFVADQRVLASALVPDARQPVLLVGFPRSGTTLLDQVLDSHPNAQVLEEKPLFARLLPRSASCVAVDGPATVQGLDPAQLDNLRRRYWALAAEYQPLDASRLFVDKNPFNLCWTYFVHHLFPQARWIYAIRHPLDSILSCHMNRFRHTEFSHGFWSLEETARIYRDSIGYWLVMRERLGLACIEVRYESLVDDPTENLQAVCRFLDLPWQDRLLNFHEHARSRRILTPSYDQVVKPIYRGAVHRWHHYRKQLAAAAEIVRPVAEVLGYVVD